MLQINRQYRQEKPSCSLRGNRIQALKLMGYHYIQENNKKFSSRLIYVLLEGLVHLYTHNAEAQLLLTGSEQDRAYVAEAIELLMKEKIEGRIILGTQLGPSNQQQVQKKNRVIEELSSENKKLKDALQEQRQKYQKESKKANKMYQKCQHITELLFEMKRKQQLQKKILEEQHLQDLQAIIEDNRRSSEELIRQKTIASLLKEENEKMSQQKQVRMQRNVQHFDQSSKKRLKLVQLSVLSIMIQPSSKALSISQQYSALIQPSNKGKKLSLNPAYSGLAYVFSEKKERSLSITRSVYSNQFGNLLQKKDASTEAQCKDSFDFKERIQSQQSQIQSLTLLNRLLQRRLLGTIQSLKEREEQYQTLVKNYNSLNDEWQDYKFQSCSNIQWLSKQLEKSLLNTPPSQEKNSAFCTASIDTLSQSEIDRPQYSQPTDRSTPSVKEEESEGFCNPFVLRERSCQSNMISKQVISTYFLQLMDRECQGQSREVMIEQIGACLGWGEKQLERIDFFRRKVKNSLHSQETKGNSFEQGIGDRFYRFLTLESDTEQ